MAQPDSSASQNATVPTAIPPPPDAVDEPFLDFEPDQERIKENPLEAYDPDEVDEVVKLLFEREFKDKKSVTEEELIVGGRLARSNYGNHIQDGEDPENSGPKPFTPSIDTVKWVLHPHDWNALEIQKSKRFWREPKALLVTLGVCCLAPMVQGWGQAANGNTGWPAEFGVKDDIQEVGTGGIWDFGVVNAVLWFSAMIGPLIFDPISNKVFVDRIRLGRRGSVLLAATFSLVGSIGASQARETKHMKGWKALLIWRIILGIGIGAKASVIPIWESEILPPAKRGRVLVSWQTFVAIGLLAGNGASYYFRNDWRKQVLSGAVPALILFVLVYISCESPRWLIMQEQYLQAFDTLVQLRKERLLAAEELCYTYFQIQAERAIARNKKPKFSVYQKPIHYFERQRSLVTLKRNLRAAVATIIVMLSQHFSGINIFAFMGTKFYELANLDKKFDAEFVDEEYVKEVKLKNNLRMIIGFSAASVAMSAIAYFLVEPLPVDTSLADLFPQGSRTIRPLNSKTQKNHQKRLKELQRIMSGRRRLLLISLASGTAMLSGLTGALSLSDDSPRKAPVVFLFMILLAFCYSPGVGAVPFLYSAEVWPNEARDVGMSVGVFVNFLGAGLLSISVPQGLAWSPVKLFGIFTGLSAFAFILVYFFVPCTNKAIALEEMAAIFNKSMLQHARNQAKNFIPKRIRRRRQFRSIPLYQNPYGPSGLGQYAAPPDSHPFHPSFPGYQTSMAYPVQQNYPYQPNHTPYYAYTPGTIHMQQGYPPQHANIPPDMAYGGMPIPPSYYPNSQDSPQGSFNFTYNQHYAHSPAVEHSFPTASPQSNFAQSHPTQH